MTQRTVPAHLLAAVDRLGNRAVLEDRTGTVGLVDLLERACQVAAGLAAAGVSHGDRVGLYADNSRRWLFADLGLQLVGAVSVPRGTDTPPQEMAGFLAHAGARVAFAHDARAAAALDAERAACPDLGEILCLDPADAPGRTLDALIEDGAGAEATLAERVAGVSPDDLVTIVYTSGTTGRPKGVMLRQSNFGHQVARCPEALPFRDEERFLSVLPVWHIFERSVEYIAIVCGCRIIYTTTRRLKEDMQRYRPTFLPSVPRIWESVYDGVKKAVDGGSPLRRGIFRAAYGVATVRTRAWDRVVGRRLRILKPRGLGVLADLATRAGLAGVAALTYLPDRLAHVVVFKKIRAATGGEMRGAISGGGHLPTHIDEFCRTVELPVLVGYGLTETSPVLTVRREDRYMMGTIGLPVAEVELEIRDPESGRALPAGEPGLIWTRGPQVMPGYYRDEALTRSVMDEAGWFNTGDLGLLTEDGHLCFRGRLKETIVLRGGENVEPSAVEQALLAAPLIDQVAVVGQDRKALAALVVPAEEPLRQMLGADADVALADLVARPEAREALRQEATRRTAKLKPFERVTRVALLGEAMSPENGLLTPTLKMRRHVIAERFAALIEEAYA